MSEPKLISPMLDNFEMGGFISDHDGVRCCPAMRKNSDDKYIVKIISVPASQTKLDALLLTGAYSSKEAALEYFKELADGIVAEKKVLDELSRLEGFVAYEDCQIVPMEDATGYDVYLLSPYRMTLERKLLKAPLTQLGAVNLGLDLCAALAICRRSGYMCIDVKPSNIVVCGEKEYRIGDLGFTSLSTLKYASMPEKYFSAYTAPEVEDAFSALSENMDIYSVGMVLYQIYNGGTLPFTAGMYPEEGLEAPAFADEEIAQIILKAVAKNPTDRWQDPVEMGQALVSYMQKNGVNDTPLTNEFFGAQEEVEAEETPEHIEEDVISEKTEMDPNEDATDVAEETVEETVEEVVEETVEDIVEEIAEAINGDFEQTEVVNIPVEPEMEISEPKVDVAEEIEETSTEEVEVTLDSAEEEAIDEAPSLTEEEVATEESYEELSFLDDDSSFEVDYDSVSDDVSEMLEQIDELAAHQIPEPPVAPEAVEIKIPEQIAEDTDSIDEAEEITEVVENTEVNDNVTSEVLSETESNEPEAEIAVEEIPEEEKPYIPKKKRTGLIWCIILLIILALGVGGYFFYLEYYLQPIHTLTLEGSEDRLQVQLTADIDESNLTVICADSHGNRIPAPVVNGTAVFTGLVPDTAYTVSVEVEGLHKLTGITSKIYSTPIQTKIAQVSVVTGSESGSVILSFAVEGPDSDQWNVIYNADGEAERVTAFPSHMVTLTDLTVGKEYTFRIEPAEDIFISGTTEVTYVAKDLICAENLHITSCIDGVLTAQWNIPVGYDVEKWTVRCFNEEGYDETVVVEDTTATFEGIDDTMSYTVDVTAEFMSVNQRVIVSANSITVTDFNVDTSRGDKLNLSWNANREIPAEGWTLRYSVDGINAAQYITARSNSAQVNVVPGGSYVFTLLDGNGNAVLGGPFVHMQEAADDFDGFNVTSSDMTVRLCNTPSASSWSYKDLEEDDYVNSFSVGQKISTVVALSGKTTNSDNDVLTTFAIYDENDELVTFSHHNQTWRSMWYENYCELDITSIPVEQGSYNMILYFNGQIVGSQKFEITA